MAIEEEEGNVVLKEGLPPYITLNYRNLANNTFTNDDTIHLPQPWDDDDDDEGEEEAGGGYPVVIEPIVQDKNARVAVDQPVCIKAFVLLNERLKVIL